MCINKYNFAIILIFNIKNLQVKDIMVTDIIFFIKFFTKFYYSNYTIDLIISLKLNN